MTYKEETYVLDTLIEIQKTIRSPEFKQLIKETHENNIMLRNIIKYINTTIAHHNQENSNDFDRNVLANFINIYSSNDKKGGFSSFFICLGRCNRYSSINKKEGLIAINKN
jgi:hypothetical protein